LSDSYSNRQIVYNNNIGHENFSPGNFKSQWIFCGTKLKSRLLFAVTKLIYVALYQLHPDEHNSRGEVLMANIIVVNDLPIAVAVRQIVQKYVPRFANCKTV
jgi:hypothetical protein